MPKKQKVYHYVDLDDSGHWCEACGNAPPGTKVYIDEYKGFNPAYWCESCVKANEYFEFEVIGWLHKDEYFETQAKWYNKNEPT